MNPVGIWKNSNLIQPEPFLILSIALTVGLNWGTNDEGK
jgi:hypothetical protein